MAKFMIRVELHPDGSAKPQSYDKLNAAMAKQGFGRELPGKKASYLLPVGTYWYQGQRTTNALRRSAAVAAESTGSGFGIAVVRANGWSVMRLDRVKAAPQT